MKRTIIKNICPVVILLVWCALMLYLLRIEDESLRTWAMMGMLVLGYILLKVYHYFEMYQNYKELYYLMRDANRKRRLSWYEGNNEKVLDYTEWIEATGDDMLEAFELIDKSFPWLPKNKLGQMNKDIERMMKNKYPPM